MLIIPELKKVLIQPPRTASTSLRQAVAQRYPKTISLYRHMEWAGVPQGYERYTPVYISRHPVLRLHSLWRYMRHASKDTCPNATQDWIDRQNKDADRDFVDWVLNSKELFNDAGTSPDGAYYSTFRSVPASRKGFWHFMADKRGVYPKYMEVLDFRDAFDVLDLEEVHRNAAPGREEHTLEMYQAVMQRHKVDEMVSNRLPIPQYNHNGEDHEIRYL